MIWGSAKNGQAEYYTLECLVFLLKNIKLSHPVYVRNAAAENCPVVTRPDRKELLAYLTGETDISSSIDKAAPVEISTQFKRTSEDVVEFGLKKRRLEESQFQMVKEKLAARLYSHGAGETVTTDNLKSLSETMSVEKIAEIKAKRLFKKRTTINHKDIEMGTEVRAMLDYDLDVTKDIVSRERQWRTRSTILQSSGKQFSKSIFAILESVKAKEEGKGFAPLAVRPKLPVLTNPVVVNTSQPTERYNRYNQPGYNTYDAEGLLLPKDDNDGFKIHLFGSYSGLSLKKVADNLRGDPSSSRTQFAGKSSSQTKKTMSRTPIIIIPAANTSLITMYNAKDILQDLHYVSIEEKKAQGAKRDNEILIHRMKNGESIPYRIIDNPQKLGPLDWERVVAVFVLGPAWQFKGWPWDGNPVDIFSKICAFHLKYDDLQLDANVSKWAVDVIQLSKTKRHGDRAALMTLWEKLDKYMARTKVFLRY